MSQVSKTSMDAPLLRLPVELVQQIAGYVTDPITLCAFVSSCRQTYFYVGKDFVHIQSSKAYLKARARNRRTTMDGQVLSTLERAARACVDKDIFAWILDLYMAHSPKCLYRLPKFDCKGQRNPNPLELAITNQNVEAIQLLLDRGMDFIRVGDPRDWTARHCPLSLALQHPSSGIARSLITAGHAAQRSHAEQAVGSNNVALAEMVIDRALQSEYAKRARLRRAGWAVRDDVFIVPDFWSSFPLRLVFNHGADKDTKMLDLVIGKGKSIQEVDYRPNYPPSRAYEYWPFADPSRPSLLDSAPVGVAVKSKCPRIAISLLKQQVQEDLHDPKVVRRIIIRLCRYYSEDQRKEDGKPPNFHATYTTFMKGFHPQFTPYLFHKNLRQQHCCDSLTGAPRADAECVRNGCDFLLTTVLQHCSPSHEVVSYLLTNGCTVSTDMLLAELYRFWNAASHCLASEDRDPDLPVCDQCDEYEGVENRFAQGKCTLRSSMSRLDALLSRMSIDSIDAIGEVTVKATSRWFRYTERKLTTTPLDFALIHGLWTVAYRLIHYGADLSLITKKAKDSIRKLYKKTFVNGGDLHPLVLDAWDGNFILDKTAFSHGLGPKRDLQRQVLTLVMLTIGLDMPPQDKRYDDYDFEVVTSRRKFRH